MKLSHVFRTDTPWSSGGLEAAKMIAPTRAIAVGLLSTNRPALDEFLSVEGISGSSLEEWIQHRNRGGAFAEATRERAASEPFEKTGLALKGARKGSGDREALWVCRPETREGDRQWRAIFVAEKGGYTDVQRDALASLVKLWQAQFNNPDEFGLSMMLVGADQRLIHTDPACKLRWMLDDVSVESLISDLWAIRDQRWPVTSTGDRIGSGCDMVVRIGAEPRWVRCQTRKAIEKPEAAHTLMEMRAIDEDELPAVGVVEDSRVGEALGYLHDHYNQGPTLSDLAAVVDVSPFHFHRVFTKHVGVSPKQYQLLKQLQVARWRLRCGREPIGSIADEVGFANHAHFTSTFRRMLGVSPSEYQRRFSKQLSSPNGELELAAQS